MNRMPHVSKRAGAGSSERQSGRHIQPPLSSPKGLLSICPYLDSPMSSAFIERPRAHMEIVRQHPAQCAPSATYASAFP